MTYLSIRKHTHTHRDAAPLTMPVGSPPPTPNSILPLAAAPVYFVVLGCAYGNQLDRAFATFEDYGPVFGLQHDTAVCNALLLACLRS